MSEAEVTAAEIVEQAQGGENEVQPEVSEPGNGAAEIQESPSNGGEVVESGESQAERAAFARQFANLARQERRLREEKQEFKGVKKKATELEGLQDMA